MNKTPLTAGIFGLSGFVLTEEEKRFFVSVNPLGFILFARNCDTPTQVKDLVSSLRELLQREDLLVLIDQEGGRVARLKPPHWRKSPPAGLFSKMAETSIMDARKATYANARLIARELNALGINVDCAPVADVPVLGAHNIIGDRAYGDDPYQVSVLAADMATGLLDGGVLPVLKHIPGHGRAKADSHEDLPIVTDSLAELEKTDFIPFKALSHLPLGMTAHIVYTAIDALVPATLSPKAIAFIRETISFDGLLMSDDVSMKALKGSLATLTSQIFAAGCDVVLHCNGLMQEMQQIAPALLPLQGEAELRFERALAKLILPKNYDYAAAEKLVSAA